MRMLTKDPAARPGAATIQRRLDPSLVAETTQRLAPGDKTIPVAESPSIDRTEVIAPAAHHERGRPVWLIAVAAVLALGAAGAFARIVSRDDTPSTAGAVATTQATTAAAAAPAATSRAVPNLAGRSVAAATAQLATRDLRLVVSGAAPGSVARGLIATQVPAARASIPPGSVVSVVLSSGPATVATEAAKPAKPAKKDKPKKRGPKRP
jgi:hypothetical protein